MTVDAVTADEAEQMARYNGVLVSAVVSEEAPSAETLPYQTPVGLAPQVATLVRTPPVATLADESVFYADDSVQVTNARLIVVGKTYAIANITSVESRMIHPDTSGYQIVLLLGSIALFVGIVVLLGGGWLVGTCALAIAAFLFWVARIVHRGLRPSYAMRVASTSGEVEALRHNDEALIARITEAVNRAIVSRK